MASVNLLAIDLGAESGRAILGGFDGRRISLEELHRFPNQPVEALGTLHWDILRLWHEIQVGLAKGAPAHPAAIGVDTWGVDFGLIGRDGRLLGNPVHYRDSRTDGMYDVAFARVPKAEIYRRTGLQFLKFNTAYQLIALERSGGLAGADQLLFIPDLLHYFLTERRGGEYTIASTSQLLDAREKCWSRELTKGLGLPLELLPPLIPTGEILGTLRPAVARATGLDKARVVASATHDTAAAVVAVPAKGEDWCYISSGTWSLMGAELAEPRITDQSLADNFTNEGGVDGTIRFLKNIMGLWLVQECRRGLARKGRDLEYAVLARLAAEATPFGPIVNPDDNRFIRPDDMPEAIRSYCVQTGQGAPNDEGSLIRCCLESLALCYRKTLEQLETNIGRRIETIHIVGGGSKNSLLCQMTADCCQRPVIAGPDEGTALGNALVQLRGLGELRSLADMREVVRNSFPTQEFIPRPDSRWDDAMARFRGLLASG